MVFFVCAKCTLSEKSDFCFGIFESQTFDPAPPPPPLPLPRGEIYLILRPMTLSAGLKSQRPTPSRSINRRVHSICAPSTLGARLHAHPVTSIFKINYIAVT